jgi:hypothetical protein
VPYQLPRHVQVPVRMKIKIENENNWYRTKIYSLRLQIFVVLTKSRSNVSILDHQLLQIYMI